MANVKPGSIIKTDCWRCYNLTGLPFQRHDKVNHKRHFVDPNDRSTHTQNIECQWSVVKRDLRRRVGRMNPTTYESFLVEWMWRSRFDSMQKLFNDFSFAAHTLYNTN